MRAGLTIVWRLAVAGMLVCALPAHAQDQLSFVSPAENSEVDLNVDQTVYLRLIRGSRPISGATIDLVTTHGELSADSVVTDLNGFGIFTIKADSEGDAIITAASTGADAVLNLQFREIEDTLSDITVRANPTGEMELLVFTDRFAFRGAPGTSIIDVARVAAAENLRQLSPLDDDLFVLQVATPMNRQSLLRLAESLRSNPDYADVIGTTGLVARLAKAQQWLVIPNQVIVRFVDGQDDGAMIGMIGKYAPVGVMPDDDERDRGRYVFALASDGTFDALSATADLNEMPDVVRYAEPNYMIARWSRWHPVTAGHPTTDDGYQWQWHLENHGTYGGLADADVDIDLAWHYTHGSHDTLIAVVDRGFDVNHYDLAANLWTKAPSHKGIDLIDGDGSDLQASINNATLYAHGTRAAGVAAATGGNVIGYSGACPSCKLMLIKADGDVSLFDEGIDEAMDAGAAVISNSWGMVGKYADIEAAISDAVDAGIVVVMAADNIDVYQCDADDPDTSANPLVIGVGGVTDYDERSNINGQSMAWGECLDVVASTGGGDQSISTTSTIKTTPNPTSTYDSVFDGTSAATPLVAGAVGLMKNLNANLSPLTIQRVLQDTADRVDPGAAQYTAVSGYSDNSGKSTHAYGRMNAGEAVQLVAPKTPADEDFFPGKGGQDLFLRDHKLDWGNTEQPSNTIFSNPRAAYGFYKSVDIKVDVIPYQLTAITSAEFDALIAEEPKAGERSRVYVRVRNRGPNVVDSASLKLIYTVVADSYPDLPSDFWTTFPGVYTDTSKWVALPLQALSGIEYSGASVAGCPGRAVPECLPLSSTVNDPAPVKMWDVPALDWDPANDVGPTFFAVVHSNEDSASGMSDPPNSSLDVLDHVNGDNNATLWTSGTADPVDPAPKPAPSGCTQDLQAVIIVLVLIGTLLVLYMVIRWYLSLPVPTWVYVAIILILGYLLFVCMTVPGCIETAIESVLP